MARRLKARDSMLAELHAKQRAVIDAIISGVQYIAVICGRRAGKTEMDARAIAIALEQCGDDEWCIYAAVTRSLAKDLIWSRLEKLNERHGFGWRMLKHEGLITTSRGGSFRVLGFDKLPELEKVRGYKLRLAVFDEPATYADKLEPLLRDCVGPALSDVRGAVLINGTPGPTRAGFWFEASTGVRSRYKTFHWTVRDNPKFPRDVEAMLAEEREENGWDEENPTYQREWMGQWVDDPSALVYKYLESRNRLYELPANYSEPDPRGIDECPWSFTIAVDFGYEPDPCAWLVLASHRNSHDMIVVHDEEHLELLPDEAAEVTARLVARYKPMNLVGDPAAKEYLKEWNRRWADDAGAWMIPADKLGKRDAIEVVNGELRAQRIMAWIPERAEWHHETLRTGRVIKWQEGAQHLASEATNLTWKTSAREEEHPALPNHALDCLLYSTRRHLAYLHELPKPTMTGREAELAAQAERIERVQSARRAEADAWDDY